MERYCLSCMGMQQHTSSDGKHVCDKCLYCFEEAKSYFIGFTCEFDTMDVDDDGNNVWQPPRCSHCREEIQQGEGYAFDADCGVVVCKDCWEEITGDFKLPMSRSAKAAFEIFEFMARTSLKTDGRLL